MRLFKKIVRDVLDRTVVPLVGYVRYRTYATVPPYTVQQELARRTAAESADYVQSEMPKALQFAKREELWDYVWEQKRSAGLVAEFGVWNGYSINRIAQKTDHLMYGFDSFAGLREDWSGGEFAKGKFDLGGKLPVVAENVRLVKGWFDETLPQFLAEHSEPFAFIHIDCDTYEAASTILDLVATRILEGTVVVFDEYFGYRGWRLGEFKAWQDFVLRHQVRYEYLAYSSTQVSVRVARIARTKLFQAAKRNLVPYERSLLPRKTSIVQE
jgi:Methyltransferase domain